MTSSGDKKTQQPRRMGTQICGHARRPRSQGNGVPSEQTEVRRGGNAFPRQPGLWEDVIDALRENHYSRWWEEASETHL